MDFEVMEAESENYAKSFQKNSMEGCLLKRENVGVAQNGDGNCETQSQVEKRTRMDQFAHSCSSLGTIPVQNTRGITDVSPRFESS